MSIIIDEEFQNLIPPLSAEEYTQLEKNCVKDGIRDPLVVWPQSNGDNILVDGHNRWNISANHGGIQFEIKPMMFESREAVKEWIIKNQLGRRNIPPYVRAELALKLKPVIAEKAKERMLNPLQNSAQGATRDQIAKAAGVSHDTIHKVEKIQEKASPEAKEALRRGDMSINQAYMEICPPKSHQQTLREFKKQAHAEHEAFQEKKKNFVVSFEDIQKDQRAQRIINHETQGYLNKAITAVSNLAFLKSKNMDELTTALSKDDLEWLKKSLNDSISLLTFILHKIGG